MTSPLESEPERAGDDAASAIEAGAVILLKADINLDSYKLISTALKDLGNQKRLMLVLESLGDSIAWAFWIAKALREHCKELVVAIPLSAKSASTLIALAADQVLMGRRGELGPLDPQQRDPTGGTVPQSPLETIQGLQYFRKYCQESIDCVMKDLLARTDMKVPYALEHTSNILASAITPLFQNVNVRELGDAYRKLLVGERYAKEVMRRWSPLNEREADAVVESLVWDYPDHGHIIDLNEAQRIGLRTARSLEAELDQLLSQIVQRSDPTTVKVIDLSDINALIATQNQESDCDNKGIK